MASLAACFIVLKAIAYKLNCLKAFPIVEVLLFVAALTSVTDPVVGAGVLSAFNFFCLLFSSVIVLLVAVAILTIFLYNSSRPVAAFADAVSSLLIFSYNALDSDSFAVNSAEVDVKSFLIPAA